MNSLGRQARAGALCAGGLQREDMQRRNFHARPSSSSRSRTSRRPNNASPTALTQSQRSQFAEAMLRDVMTAAAGVLGPPRRRAGHRRRPRPAARARLRLRRHRGHAQRERDRRHRDGHRLVRAARLRHDGRRSRRHSAHHQRRAASRARRRTRRGCGLRSRLRSPRQQLHPAPAGVAHSAALRQRQLPAALRSHAQDRQGTGHSGNAGHRSGH